MDLNSTPSGERLHIGFFGRRNVGKSSVVNAVTGQKLAIVSEVMGTTTDPVYKSMELLPLGPVMVIDTPGMDDEGELGTLRVKKTRQVLQKTDLAVLVADCAAGIGPVERELLTLFRRRNIPHIVAFNKSDLWEPAAGIEGEALAEPDSGSGLGFGSASGSDSDSGSGLGSDSGPDPGRGFGSVQGFGSGAGSGPGVGLGAGSGPGSGPDSDSGLSGLCLVGSGVASVRVSAKTGAGICRLKELVASLGVMGEPERSLLADLVAPGDLVVLVVPLDAAAPKGRLILPQQQTIRAILDAGAIAVTVKDSGLEEALSKLGQKPSLVITDSQVFAQVAEQVPEDIPLTSFSILFARYKGDLDVTATGAATADSLQMGDRILIAEGCTHHRQCGDIGTEKLPRWLMAYTGCELDFAFSSGTEFPEDLSPYRLIVHCGGCMLNRREMKYRLAGAADAGVDITNYGILIAQMNGILQRSMAPMRR